MVLRIYAFVNANMRIMKIRYPQSMLIGTENPIVIHRIQ